jgi:hypothetical protein
MLDASATAYVALTLDGTDTLLMAADHSLRRDLSRRIRDDLIHLGIVKPGPAGGDDETDPTALFDQVYVDPGPLRAAVRSALRRATQVGLADLIVATPLTLGAAELVTYLTLRDDAFTIVYDEARTEQIGWNAQDGSRRTATLPRVTFTRSKGSAA